MAMKWVPLAALFLVCIISIMAEGSIYRITIKDDNQACPRIGLELSDCRRYMEKRSRGLLLKESENQPGGPRRCCQRLRRAGMEECQCEALRGLVQQTEQEEEMAARRAQELAYMCGLEDCNIRGYE